MLQKMFDAVKMHEDGDGPLFTVADNQATRRAKAWLAAQIKRGSKEVFGISGELTPELAELLLGANPDNRQMSDRIAGIYARDIENGAWDFNGEAIIVSRDGHLNDGQHRCAAVKMAGRAITSLFVFGVERQTRLTLDAGKAREVGDYLRMSGYESAKQLAAIARLVWQYDTRGMMSDLVGDRPTKQQILDFALNHPGMKESANFCVGGYSRVIRSHAVLAACHFIFHRVNPADADSFIESLMSGENLEKHMATHTTRERLLTEKQSRRRMSAQLAASIIIHGWNAFRQGRKIQRINAQGIFPRAI